MKTVLVGTLLVFSLVSAARIVSRGTERGPVGRSQRGLPAGRSFAEFEFLPVTGEGAGEECACTALTTAKGEAVTFTRGSVGVCVKGGKTSGIVPGDVVKCPADVPRLVRFPNTSGQLGLYMEKGSTNAVSANLFSRTEEFDNAAWSKSQSNGATVPSVTADQGVAPDNTTTADLVTFYATTASQESYIAQAVGGTGTQSVYVKGYPQTWDDGGSDLDAGYGSFDLCLAVGNGCTTCTYNPNTWTRCFNAQTSISGSNWYYGNAGLANGNIVRPRQSVLLWGALATQAQMRMEYLPCTSSSCSRGSDNLVFTSPSTIGPNLCIAANVWADNTVTANMELLRVGGFLDYVAMYRDGGSGLGLVSTGTMTAPYTIWGTTPHRIVYSSNGGTQTASVDGTTVSAPSGGLDAGQTRISFGASDGGLILPSRMHIYGVKVSNDPASCN